MPASNAWRSILCFLVIAFGFTWSLWWLLLHATNYLPVALHAPMFIFGMIAVNWGPAIGALVATRWVLRESWRTTTVDRLGRKRYYVWAWLLPAAGSVLAGGLALLLGAASLDLGFQNLHRAVESSGMFPPFPWRLQVPFGAAVVARIAFVLVAAPVINAPSAFGEELGWRGFLLSRLMRAGLTQWQALIASGVIWGLWHAPVIAMGQTNYPDHPLLGILLMAAFCGLLGIVFGWLQLASGSVWVPTAAHGALNGIASLPLLILAPRDFALGGTLASVTGWIPVPGFIAWLAWSGRLPVRSPLEASHSSIGGGSGGIRGDKRAISSAT